MVKVLETKKSSVFTPFSCYNIMVNLQYNGEVANIFVVKEISACSGEMKKERETVGSFLNLNKKGPTTNGLIK